MRAGLLEDRRPEDKSRTTARNAQTFFEKVLAMVPALNNPGIVGAPAAGTATAAPGQLGMLAAGIAAPTSSFYSLDDPSTNMNLPQTDADVTETKEAEQEAYDPFKDRTLGLGKVFIEFDSKDAAVVVQKELSGRAFNGRILCTTFVDADAFLRGEYCAIL
jgi:hypothetical protein